MCNRVVWIKEYGKLTVDSIKHDFFSDVKVEKLNTQTELADKDIIIYSSEDSCNKTDFLPYTSYKYEDLFGYIYSYVIEVYEKRKQFFHLKNAIKAGYYPDIDTIIAGNSYGHFGIDESMLENAVNLSLPSQDLYYSIASIKKICKTNKYIRNVVFCEGYYAFYPDISKVFSLGGAGEGDKLIGDVYEPLFGDAHNAPIIINDIKTGYVRSEIIDVEKILNEYAIARYYSLFFNKDNPRKSDILLYYGIHGRWADLDENTKKELSYDRAIEHNKEIVYKKSFEENVNLFSSFMAWAEENKINVLMTVAPATQYYNLYIDNKFREGFYSILNELPQEIHVLDLSSSKEFTDDDFLDMDHLNEQGAIKYTSMIFDTIKKM